MPLLHALFLGVVQGLTEFLPVSSSGHLVIFQHLLNFEEPPIMFDAILHGGTLVAVLYYFWKDIIHIKLDSIKKIVIATIPAVIGGLFLNDYIDSVFSSITIVGVGLLITALQLFLSKEKANSDKTLATMNMKDSLIIGLFQAVALFPGISRSGSTVTAALRQGLVNKDAFKFSFLLSLVAILGAIVLQVKDYTPNPTETPEAMIVGFIASLVTGLFALKLLDHLVKKAKLHYFGYYCVVVSLLIFALM